MDIEVLRQADELEEFIKACAVAIGLKAESVVRFPTLFQIMETGVDIAWEETGSPEEGPGWVLKQTYTDVDVITGEAITRTDRIVSCEPHETALIAKAALQLVADHMLDAALAEVVPREGA